MRELSTPSLFDSSPPQTSFAETESVSNEKLAKEFVRWCCSFGNTFRNSPDAANLRYWAKKANVKIQESGEANLLSEARKQYQKRLIQSTAPSAN